ncbi:helix-turn-helix domain-containing protein [Qipengyuania sp. XHP0207]|uniref:helix-turn-helix transcriptional regulator n=1 Tax=Qipengyuania sp. XHP0207 TaxID=3038078 RepID=UPI00241C12CC|nr:helix-turn-helix domain-containing protein [Qipengyuania sp. XHP0207]MDG5748205.1 helix-turn-helix domain-containing protein [Qipengyuania sp. XHP0207]
MADRGLVSLTGRTPDGKPLAYSRGPAPDLAPWVHSLAVADVVETTGEAQTCAFFSENAAIRVLLKGRWHLQTDDGPLSFDAAESSRILYFGPQTRIMPLRVEGPFRFIQMQFRPGTNGTEPAIPLADAVDRVLPFDGAVPQEKRGSYFREEDGRDRWLDIFETVARQVLLPLVAEAPPPMIIDFERHLLADQSLNLEDFAQRHAVSRRTLERAVFAAFGISPKAALRRARALDMAAALLGVAMPEEDAEFRLRYFDQAHMTKQIKTYFGMSPGTLSACEAHLLRIDLEIRQMRRLAIMQELGLSDVPWRADGPEHPRQ